MMKKLKIFLIKEEMVLYHIWILLKNLIKKKDKIYLQN